MGHQGFLMIELAIMGLFGGFWSIAGTRLVRKNGYPWLEKIGYGAGAVSLVLSLVYLVWGFTR